MEQHLPNHDKHLQQLQSRLARLNRARLRLRQRGCTEAFHRLTGRALALACHIRHLQLHPEEPPLPRQEGPV